MTWAGWLLIVIVIVFVGILARSAYTYKPHRARNVKYAEQHQAAVVEHVVRATASHPEIVKISRLDRHWWYIGPALAMFGYSVCISVFNAPLTSNVISLGQGARFTMASCFMVGSALVLIGSMLGATFGRWTINPTTKDHLTAEVLGDDIVFPYRVAMAGWAALTVSLGIYAWTSFQVTIGSLGGWFTAIGTGASIGTILTLNRAAKVFEKWDYILISEAHAAVRRRNDAEPDN